MRYSLKSGSVLQAPLQSREALAEAFADFTRAAGLLEYSYRELQQEVAGLRQELEEKNRHLAASLQENERIRCELQNLLEALPCGVVLQRADGQGLQLCNPAAVRLLEGTQDHQVLFGGLGHEEEHELAITAGDQVRHLAVRSAAFAAGQSGPETLYILRDTTAQHRLEEEREKLRCMQALAESSAVLAHEVRNPLASMELFASLLVDSAVSREDEIRNWAQHIQAGVRMIASTVNNVLHLRNAGPLQSRPTELNELVASTVQLLYPLAHQAGVEIDFSPASRSLTVAVDASRLQQVFFNLAVNAFRAMRPGGTLSLRLQGSPVEGIEVEFRDQGCGIAEEDRQRIFEPGFTRDAGHSGFGLAVCRKIMEQHGGAIQVESELGKGTSMILMFPPQGGAA